MSHGNNAISTFSLWNKVNHAWNWSGKETFKAGFSSCQLFQYWKMRLIIDFGRTKMQACQTSRKLKEALVAKSRMTGKIGCTIFSYSKWIIIAIFMFHVMQIYHFIHFLEYFTFGILSLNILNNLHGNSFLINWTA